MNRKKFGSAQEDDSPVHGSYDAASWRNSPTLDALRSGALDFGFRFDADEEGEKLRKSENSQSENQGSENQRNNQALYPLLAKALPNQPSWSSPTPALPPRHNGPKSVPRFPLLKSDEILNDAQELCSPSSDSGRAKVISCFTTPVSVQLATMVYQLRELCHELHQESTTVWFDYRRCMQEEKRFLSELRDTRTRAENAESAIRQMQLSLATYEDIEKVRSQDDDRQQKSIEGLRKFIDMERRMRLEAEEAHKRAAIAWSERENMQNVRREEMQKEIDELTAQIKLHISQQQKWEEVARTWNSDYDKRRHRQKDLLVSQHGGTNLSAEMQTLGNFTNLDVDYSVQAEEKAFISICSSWPALTEKLEAEIDELRAENEELQSQATLLRSELSASSRRFSQVNEELSEISSYVNSFTWPDSAKKRRSEGMISVNVESPSIICLDFVKNICGAYREAEQARKALESDYQKLREEALDERNARSKTEEKLEELEGAMKTMQQEHEIAVQDLIEKELSIKGLKQKLSALQSRVETERAKNDAVTEMMMKICVELKPILSWLDECGQALTKSENSLHSSQFQLSDVRRQYEVYRTYCEQTALDSESKLVASLDDLNRIEGRLVATEQAFNKVMEKELEMTRSRDGFKLEVARHRDQDSSFGSILVNVGQSLGHVQCILSSSLKSVNERRNESAARQVGSILHVLHLREVIEDFNTVCIQFEQDFKAVEDQQAALLVDMQSDNKKVQTLQLQLEARDAQLEKAEIDLQFSRSLLRKCDSEKIELQQAIQALLHDLETERSAMICFQSHLTEGEKRLEQADQIMMQIRAELEQYKMQAQEINNARQKLVNQLEEERRNSEFLQNEAECIRNAIAKSDEQSSVIKREFERSQKKTNDLQDLCNTLDADLKMARESEIKLQFDLSESTLKAEKLGYKLQSTCHDLDREKLKNLEMLQAREMLVLELQREHEDLMCANEILMGIKINIEMEEQKKDHDGRLQRKQITIELDTLRNRIVEEVMLREQADEEMRSLKRFLEQRNRDEWEQKETIDHLYREIRIQGEKSLALEDLVGQLKSELEMVQTDHIKKTQAIQEVAKVEFLDLHNQVETGRHRCDQLDNDLQSALKESKVLQANNQKLNKQLEECFLQLQAQNVEFSRLQSIVGKLETDLVLEREKLVALQVQKMHCESEVQLLKEHMKKLMTEKERVDLNLQDTVLKLQVKDEALTLSVEAHSYRCAEYEGRLENQKKQIDQAKSRLLVLMNRYKRPVASSPSFENSDTKSAETTFLAENDWDLDRDVFRSSDTESGLECCSTFSFHSNPQLSLSDCISLIEEMLKGLESHAFHVEHQLILKSVSERANADTLRADNLRLGNLLKRSESLCKEKQEECESLLESSKRDNRVINDTILQMGSLSNELKSVQLQLTAERCDRHQAEQRVKDLSIDLMNSAARESQIHRQFECAKGQILDGQNIVEHLQENLGNVKLLLSELNIIVENERNHRDEVDLALARMLDDSAKREESHARQQKELISCQQRVEIAKRECSDQEVCLRHAQEELEALNCLLASEIAKRDHAVDMYQSALQTIKDMKSDLEKKDIFLQNATKEVNEHKDSASSFRLKYHELEAVVNREKAQTYSEFEAMKSQYLESISTLETELRYAVGQKQLLEIRLDEVLKTLEQERDIQKMQEGKIDSLISDVGLLSQNLIQSEKALLELTCEAKCSAQIRDNEILRVRQALEQEAIDLKAQVLNEIQKRLNAENLLRDRSQLLDQQQQEIKKISTEYEKLFHDAQDLSERASCSEAALRNFNSDLMREREDFEGLKVQISAHAQQELDEIGQALSEEIRRRVVLETILASEREETEILKGNIHDLQSRLSSMSSQSSLQIHEANKLLERAQERNLEVEAQKSRLIEELHELRWAYKKEIESVHSKLRSELKDKDSIAEMFQEAQRIIDQQKCTLELQQAKSEALKEEAKEYALHAKKATDELDQFKLDIISERAQRAKEKQEMRSQAKQEISELILRVEEEIELKNLMLREIEQLKECIAREKERSLFCQQAYEKTVLQLQDELGLERERAAAMAHESEALKKQIEAEMIQREHADESLRKLRNDFDSQSETLRRWKLRITTLESLPSHSLLARDVDTTEPISSNAAELDPSDENDKLCIISVRNEEDLGLEGCEMGLLNVQITLDKIKQEICHAIQSRVGSLRQETLTVQMMKSVLSTLAFESEEQCRRAAAVEEKFLSSPNCQKQLDVVLGAEACDIQGGNLEQSSGLKTGTRIDLGSFNHSIHVLDESDHSLNDLLCVDSKQQDMAFFVEMSSNALVTVENINHILSKTMQLLICGFSLTASKETSDQPKTTITALSDNNSKLLLVSRNNEFDEGLESSTGHLASFDVETQTQAEELVHTKSSSHTPWKSDIQIAVGMASDNAEGCDLKSQDHYLASILSELESEKQTHQTRNALYVQLQEEISTLKERLVQAELLYEEAKSELIFQKSNFEEQIRNIMHACVAEELVSEEYRKREAKALDKLSVSYRPSFDKSFD